MRIYCYWEVKDVEINGCLHHFRAGSNVSQAHAKELIEQKIIFCTRFEDPEQKPSEVEKMMMRNLFSDGHVGSNYEVEIAEPIIHTLNDKNIITRNRYGALVLNSTDHFFLDIDSVPVPFWESFAALFGKSVPDNKERIVRLIHDLVKKEPYFQFSYRIYETFQGIRLLIQMNDAPAPNSLIVKDIMQAFKSDPLYGELCRKQNCFRARLTPKPVRMKHFKGSPANKMRFPYSEQQRKQLEEWATRYKAEAQKYAVCRVWETIGTIRQTPVLDYHDHTCNTSNDSLPLA